MWPSATWPEATPVRAQYVKEHNAGRDRMLCSASKDKAELMRGDVVASSEGGKASKDVHGSSNWPTSFKAFPEKGRDGEGAVARRRNPMTRRDANKPELVDFKQGERTTDDKRWSRAGRCPVIAVDPFTR